MTTKNTHAKIQMRDWLNPFFQLPVLLLISLSSYSLVVFHNEKHLRGDVFSFINVHEPILHQNVRLIKLFCQIPQRGLRVSGGSSVCQSGQQFNWKPF